MLHAEGKKRPPSFAVRNLTDWGVVDHTWEESAWSGGKLLVRAETPSVFPRFFTAAARYSH